MAFIEFITRTYQRPGYLATNRASLSRLTDPDYLQSILVDNEGRGVEWANAQLADFTPDISTKYVMMLDDDDMLIYPKLIGDLKAISEMRPNTAAFITKTNHNELGILPPSFLWEKAPVEGQIGNCSITVRRDVWEKHKHSFLTKRYASDFDFTSSVWKEHSKDIVWYNVVAAKVQFISRGRPE